MKKEEASLYSAIVEISQDKDIDKSVVIKALEFALTNSAAKKYIQYSNIEARFETTENIVRIFYYKKVVENVNDDNNEISIISAKDIDSQSQLDDEIEYEIESEEFINIIAQTARQAFFQKIEEYENQIIKEKYQDNIKEIIFGTIGQVNKNRCIVNLKKNASAVLDKKNQIYNEKLTPGESIKSLLSDIYTEGTRTTIFLSRTHPDFLAKLLELEIPEVYDSTVEILAVARDPGKRAKVAVKSNNSDVDPVGSCVGKRGERIQAIVNELNGEKIDVVRWSSDTAKFISDALVPAEINKIEINDEKNIANVFVDMQNIVLAIGKKGQNVKLASKLTKFEINILLLEDKNEETEEDLPNVQLFSGEEESNTNIKKDNSHTTESTSPVAHQN